MLFSSLHNRRAELYSYEQTRCFDLYVCSGSWRDLNLAVVKRNEVTCEAFYCYLLIEKTVCVSWFIHAKFIEVLALVISYSATNQSLYV